MKHKTCFMLHVSCFMILIAILAILLLLICSALVSGAEIAYFSLDHSDIEWLKYSKTKTGKIVLQLLDTPKRLLATLLITNNFVNVAIIILSTYLVDELFDLSQSPLLSFAVQVIAITSLILLIGEVIPKVYATHHTILVATMTAYPVLFLKTVLRPLSYLIISSTSVIHNKIKRGQHNISVDELSDALELTSEDAPEEEQKILKGIVEFGNTDVKQIMKSRVDVTAIDYDTNYDELISIILDSGFSRIPVYKDNFDNIEGVLYIKDMLISTGGKDDFNWHSLIRSPFYVPENKKIDDLMREFQEKKIHLAIVVDEYGGTSGIVTLEDIIEEIVGEISDEFDTEETGYSKLDESNYVFEGKTALNDLYRITGINGDAFEEIKGDSDTLAGFILELAGKIPEKDEKITFENVTFTIEAANKRRIKRAKVSINDN